MSQKEKTLPPDTFKTKPDNLKMTQGVPVILDCSKTSKIRSFIDRAHFYPMLLMASATSRNNNIRSSNDEQR